MTPPGSFRKITTASSHPVVTPGVRIETIHLLYREQGAPPEIPPHDVPGEGPSSSHMYVPRTSPVCSPTCPNPGYSPPRSSAPQLTQLCSTDMIDKATHEIRQDEDKIVYKSLDDLAEDLPDNSPRFVLLSYPLTMVNTRPRGLRYPGVAPRDRYRGGG